MRDRKRLITLIRTHQHLLDPVRFKYNPKFEEYIPVKQSKLSHVMSGLTFEL